MSLIESIYMTKYKSLLNKIENLNKKNIVGYKTFKEYVLSDEIMISYFNDLKRLEKNFTKLHVDSLEIFERRLFNQLKTIYDKTLVEIFKNNDEQGRNAKLLNFKNEIRDSYGHNCDGILNELLEDLNYKIKNADKFKITTIKKDIMSEDPQMEDIIIFISKTGHASASLLQRKFNFTYSRASRIIDILEENGYIGAQSGSKPRNVYINDDNITNTLFKNTLEEMSSEEYNEYQLEKHRIGKNINEIMLEYGIKTEYGKKNLFDGIFNSLIVNSSNENERYDLINNLIKYMSPDDLKITLIGYNKITFNNYNGLPHLFLPIACDIKKASIIIESLSEEMEQRYDLFLKNKVKSYDEYNKITKIPYLLLIIDEVSELFNDKKAYDYLVKILLNGSRAGIKIIMFTKFSKKNINIGSIEDLLLTYNKYNFDNIINGKDYSFEKIKNVDLEMNGFDFEKYSGELLYANGFDKIKVTQASGDFGVDIIAYKDDIKYAIQCKKYSSPVGIKAVQEVIGSKAMNDCHVAAVLTNNTFTKSAKELAEKNNVLLWDRDKLKTFIENYKNRNN